jgi:hypothetical protein
MTENLKGFRERFAISTFANGGVAISLTTGAYFRLNSSAARICEALDRCVSPSEAEMALRSVLPVPESAVSQLMNDLLGHLSRAYPEPPPAEPFVFEPGTSRHILRVAGRRILDVDDDGSSIGLVCRPEELPLPLEHCLRVAGPRVVFLQGGTVLHASAAVVNGELIAFCGASGAGKTTTALALKSAGAQLVSQDVLFVSTAAAVEAVTFGESALLNWVSMAADAMHQAPEARFSCIGLGEVATGSTQRIGKIVFLKSSRRGGAEVITEPLPHESALCELLPCIFVAGGSPRHWGRFLREAHAIITAVPTFLGQVPHGLRSLQDAAMRYIVNSAS